MGYVNFERLEALDPVEFQTRDPYPWVNPEGLIVEEGYERLVATLPELSLFEQVFNRKRMHGQQSHDRYALEYRDGLPLAEPWQTFVDELKSERYRAAIGRLYGVGKFDMNFHWHYTPRGCSVSPHCDAKRKIGSHIFYFNTERDWQPDWGGETLILDDGGRFKYDMAPGFGDFERTMASEAIGNYSLLFGRKGNSWHGVREITCPEGHLRKVFIVVINHTTPIVKLRRLFGRLPEAY